MDEVWLTVGEVARRSGLTVRTLHHYDAIGLLVPSERTDADYRLYSDADLRRLLSIQHLKGLGLGLADIAAALDDPDFEASDAVGRHIAAVEARIAEERELLTRLRSLRDAAGVGWSEVLDVIALTERLRHADPGVRVQAALTAPGTAPLRTLVESLMTEPDPGVRETLTWAIARHGSAALNLLTPRLGAAEPALRLRALHALGKLHVSGVATAAAPLLDDPDAGVAAKAAFVLGQAGDPAFAPALAGVLDRPEAVVAEEVTSALARLGPTTVPLLTGALAEGPALARVHAADALGVLAAPSADAALARALTDIDPSVRFAALAALGQLNTATARDAIAGAVTSHDARISALATRLLAGPAGARPLR